MGSRFSVAISLLRNRLVWLIAASETAGLLFQYFGQKFGASPAISSLISLTFLVIVPFLSLFLLQEKIYPFHILSILLGMIGVFTIQTEWQFDQLNPLQESQIAITLLFLSALSYAFYVVLTSRLTTIESKDVDTTVLFYVVLFIISILTVLAGLVAEPKTIFPSEKGWIWILSLALISTIIAFFTYFKALTVISANEASVLLLLQIVVPFFYELVIERTSYSQAKWMGIIPIIVAMVVVVQGSNRIVMSTEQHPVEGAP